MSTEIRKESSRQTFTTFRPLKRGWYKCNQTGERVSQKDLKGYKARRLNAVLIGERQRRAQQEQERLLAEKRTRDRERRGTYYY